MAALSNSNTLNKVTSVGPFKLEVVWAPADTDDGSFESDLQRPIAAVGGTFNGTISTTLNAAVYCGTTAGSKTVTVDGMFTPCQALVLVFGF